MSPLVLAVLAGVAPSSTMPWPEKVVSWWYAADNNWPRVIEQINQTERLPLVTSVILTGNVSDKPNAIETRNPNK